MRKAALQPLAVYKALPKTNCGRCLLPTCLAFAAAVVAGHKQLSDCPDLPPELGRGLLSQAPPVNREMDQAEFVDELQRQVASLDLAAAAERIGAEFTDGRVVVRALGKDFTIDRQGDVSSECHVISWVQVPLLSYLVSPSHEGISGQWISFREIPGGIDWQGLFGRRCERPLRELADANPTLLSDLIDLFQGRAVDWYEADIALILHPLPHFPILICYQAPEDDLGSKLTIFFDRCCATNLHVKPIFTLCAGLVQMFAKIASRHL